MRQKIRSWVGDHRIVLCHTSLNGPNLYLRKHFAFLSIHAIEDALFLIEFMEVYRLRPLWSSKQASIDIASNVVAFPFLKPIKKCIKERKWRKKSHVCSLPKDHFKNIYFWLLWVFVAEYRLSLVAVSRGYSSCGGRFLIVVASLVVAHRL